MKIDTSTWKKFCFTEIFKVCKGFYNKKPEPSGMVRFLFLVQQVKTTVLPNIIRLKKFPVQRERAMIEMTPCLENYFRDMLCV